MATYKVLLKGKAFEFDDAELATMDIVPTQEDRFHFLHKHQSYLIRKTQNHQGLKKFNLELNGEVYTLEILNPTDLLIQNLGFEKEKDDFFGQLEAPMPGLVISIPVKNGETVLQGEPLLILEAMKMENALLAPRDLVVKEVLVVVKEAVEKKQVLITFES